jgi:hypothetical protein
MSESEVQPTLIEAVWVFQTSQGEVCIGQTCQESCPCQGHVLRCNFNVEIHGSVGIWRFIKRYSDLEKTHPDLWDHFSPYDKPQFVGMQ